MAAIAGGWGANSTPPWEGAQLPAWFEAIPAVAVFAIIAAILTIAFGFVSWRFHTYRITDNAVEQRRGVIMRQQRQARLDRLQAVDLVQPWQGRIFGFARLVIEVAGGSNSAIQLQYLRLADAEALRNEIMELAAGARATAPADGVDSGSGLAAPGPEAAQGSSARRAGMVIAPAPGSAPTAVRAAEERRLVSVPIGRVAGSLLLSGATITALVTVAVFLAFSAAASLFSHELDLVAVVTGGGAIGLLSAVFGFGSYLVATVNSSVNFKLALASDGIRLSHGLLDTRRQTIPPGRVQAVRFTQQLLWRSRDWWRLVVNVAGYQDNQNQVSNLLPVATRPEALVALATALPGATDAMGADFISRVLQGRGADGGFLASPRSARVLDPWGWSTRGALVTDAALFIRRGRFTRQVDVVPHERIQSLAIKQGPLQRSLGLASVEIHSTKGQIVPIAAHLAFADAVALLDIEAAHARKRRQAQTPEQWLLSVEAAQEAVAEDGFAVQGAALGGADGEAHSGA